jgi:hypothetical protein
VELLLDWLSGVQLGFVRIGMLKKYTFFKLFLKVVSGIFFQHLVPGKSDRGDAGKSGSVFSEGWMPSRLFRKRESESMQKDLKLSYVFLNFFCFAKVKLTLSN